MLKDDDIAFALETYGGNAGNGTVAGVMQSANGRSLRGALIHAIDPDTGVAVSGFSSVNDESDQTGTFLFSVPPGNYVLYAEPLGSIVFADNLYLDSSKVDSNFETLVLGGKGQPTRFAVAAGKKVQAKFVVPVVLPVLMIESAAVGSAELMADPILIPSGRAVAVTFSGPGLSGVQEGGAQVLGPATVVPGEPFRFHERHP